MPCNQTIRATRLSDVACRAEGVGASQRRDVGDVSLGPVFACPTTPVSAYLQLADHLNHLWSDH